MLIYQVKTIYRELPIKIKGFIIRAFFLFIGWLLVYHLILQPLGMPDKQLTQFIEYGSAKVLSLFYTNVHIVGVAIYVGKMRAVGIAPECNGLELLVLYVGFLLCLPTNKKRLVLFAAGGVTLVCVLNMIRCAALASMNIEHNAFVDFAHHYAFKLIIYGVVFYTWIMYSKKFNPHAVPQ